jgi:TrmH family RNA methyltransferase
MQARTPPDLITSRANPLIRQVRALRESKARKAAGLFLVEGIHPVGEAIAAGWDITAIIYAPESLRSGYALDVVAGFSGRKERVAASVFRAISEKDNPQGIMAVVRRPSRKLVSLEAGGRAVALESPQDPGNVGTVLRTMDAVEGDTLFLLGGGVDPYHPAVVRASMGALFWIPVYTASFAEFLKWKRAHACQLIGTSAHGGTNSRGFAPTAPWVLLLGSEQKGLSEETKAQCDIVLTLPMRGRASSLNLAVAAGILLYGLIS